MKIINAELSRLIHLDEVVDGYLIFEDDNGLRHFMPFRSKVNGGSQPLGQTPPFIWSWMNPKEDISNITLRPSYDDPNTGVHIYITGGEIQQLD